MRHAQIRTLDCIYRCGIKIDNHAQKGKTIQMLGSQYQAHRSLVTCGNTDSLVTRTIISLRNQRKYFFQRDAFRSEQLLGELDLEQPHPATRGFGYLYIRIGAKILDLACRTQNKVWHLRFAEYNLYRPLIFVRQNTIFILPCYVWPPCRDELLLQCTN